jgi:4a-hydroxytetrahydrobiopterin dehydratase
MTELLDQSQIDAELENLPDWERTESGGESAITATFEFDDFAGSLRFVDTVGELAEEAQHHPDIDIRWNRVTLLLTTHSAGGVTRADLELALRISAQAG